MDTNCLKGTFTQTSWNFWQKGGHQRGDELAEEPRFHSGQAYLFVHQLEQNNLVSQGDFVPQEFPSELV